MKTQIDRLNAFNEDDEELVNVVVETPKGSRVKFSYDTQSGFFKLSKALPEGMLFPFNFGFVPETVAEDGDPVDILVINEEPLMAGCLLKVRPIAVIEATQTEKDKTIRNDRIIGEAIGKETPAEWRPAKLTKQMLYQIEFFFKAYNKLYGKKFKVVGTGGPGKAIALIHRGVKLKKNNQ